jgi:hypothetical protein
MPSAQAAQAQVVQTQDEPPPEQTSTALQANPSPQSASAAHAFGENTHSCVTTGSHASGTQGGHSHGSQPASPAGQAHAQGVQVPPHVVVTSWQANPAGQSESAVHSAADAYAGIAITRTRASTFFMSASRVHYPGRL